MVALDRLNRKVLQNPHPATCNIEKIYDAEDIERLYLENCKAQRFDEKSVDQVTEMAENYFKLVSPPLY